MSPGVSYPNQPIRILESPKMPPDISLRPFPALTAAWKHSHAMLTRLVETLHASPPDSSVAVMVAGSYGRMDAGGESDADFLVLLDGARDESRASQAIAHVGTVLGSLGFPMPNPQGLFAKPVWVDDLPIAIGDRKDDLFELARRMVLLLEVKCVFNEPLARKAIESVLSKYLHYQFNEPHKYPLFLLNDVIRYFRSICVNYETKFWDEHDKWAIRNAKLRHSRIWMYFGLLTLILNSSVKEDRLLYLLAHIRETPLERIAHVYSDVRERDMGNILGPYSTFIAHINDKGFRQRLSKANYEDRYDVPEYALMKTTSDAISAEMTRFVLDRRGYWPHKVMSYLMF